MSDDQVGALPFGTGPVGFALIPCGSQPEALAPSAKLTALEIQTLMAWDQCSVGYGFSFKVVAKNCETPPHLIRRVVRSLARKGMLAYARTLYEEDEPRIGAGYTLTEAGGMYIGIMALDEVPS